MLPMCKFYVSLQKVVKDAESKRKKVVSVTVRELVEFESVSGSIDNAGPSVFGLVDGKEGHQLYQEDMRRIGAQTETPVSLRFNVCDREFQISGRMDLYYPHLDLVEELKVVGDPDLYFEKLQKDPGHDWWYQLFTYAYLKTKSSSTDDPLTIKSVRLTLINSRTLETKCIDREVSLSEFEVWIWERLKLISYFEDLMEKRRVERRIQSKSVKFPYDKLRPSQKDLMDKVEHFLSSDEDVLFFQAPTGMGKTISAMVPALKLALKKKSKVVYLTPKTNIQVNVQKEIANLVSTEGLDIKYLRLSNKETVCKNPGARCSSETCPFAMDFYKKSGLDKLSSGIKNTADLNAFINEYSDENTVCPYYLGKRLLPFADILTADYNYVFSRSGWNDQICFEGFAKKARPILLVDEAHNLKARAKEYFSPSLKRSSFQSALEKLADPRNGEVNSLEEAVNEFWSIMSQTQSIDLKALRKDISNLHHIFSAALHRLIKKLPMEKQDILLEIFFTLTSFSDTLEQIIQQESIEHQSKQNNFYVYLDKNTEDSCVSLNVLNASDHVNQRLNGFYKSILFSATLKPFDHYRSHYLTDLKYAPFYEASDDVPQENRRLLIIPQVRSNFRDRDRCVKSLNQIFERLYKSVPGNYLLFLPSFSFLETVRKGLDHDNFDIYYQEKNEGLPSLEEKLNKIEYSINPSLLILVQGSVMAEGIGLGGNIFKGTIICGPPISNIKGSKSVELIKTAELLRDRQLAFKEVFINEAMSKVTQSLGRTIRKCGDRSLAILLDHRFLMPDYFSSLPSQWLQRSPIEHIPKSIIHEIREFWGE